MPTVRGIADRLRRRGNPRRFRDSTSYWDERYRRQGNSGPGSYGRLGEFKARTVNQLVNEFDAPSVIEWGCGDGAQLGKLQVGTYIGIDVSPTAIRHCRQLYESDPSKIFLTTEQAHEALPRADVALSLDVIYHLVEDRTYESYMRSLFRSATRLVIIYSSNAPRADTASHVRHRRFTDWVDAQASDWHLDRHIANPYPVAADDPDGTSPADFFVYKWNAR